jgi:hypothetical protein
MTRRADGAFAAAVEVPPGTRRYKFIVDGTRWIPDPTNPRGMDDGNGGSNSVLFLGAEASFDPSLARLGDEALAPAWTDFNATVGFSTFDVTAALAADGAPHALGVAAGRGWWSLAPLRMWGSNDFRAALPSGAPQVRALLVATFSDGSDAAFLLEGDQRGKAFGKGARGM